MTALGGGYERKPEEKKRLIVNEQGEFVRPSDLQKTMGGPLFSPVFAGAAMALSSVTVVLNSLRLGLYKSKKK